MFCKDSQGPYLHGKENSSTETQEKGGGYMRQGPGTDPPVMSAV